MSRFWSGSCLERTWIPKKQTRTMVKMNDCSQNDDDDVVCDSPLIRDAVIFRAGRTISQDDGLRNRNIEEKSLNA